MDTDLVLTIGLVLLVLSVPSLLAAWAESRAPRMGAIMAITSLGYFYISNRHTFSAFLNRDLMQLERIESWADYISELLLDSVRKR